MRALGLPGIMADMALLALRYIQEIGQDLRKMQASMRLRGFRKRRLSLYGLRTLAWLGGSILVRSYERSEWVYKAMILRGYGHAPHPRAEFQTCRHDVVTLGIFLLIAAGFITGDILFGHGASALLQ
jgi:cobalt/nickel transport system permease protein